MVNRYLVSIPVKTWQEAGLLGSETNWIILDSLREAGLDGLTIEEISKQTRVPKSTVYNVVRALNRAKLVESRPLRARKWGAPAKEDNRHLSRAGRVRGKQARVYFENMPWGSIKFDRQFYESVQPLLAEYKDKLWEQWFSALKEMVNRFRTDEKLKEFFPSEKRICEDCGWSHEAADFIWALNFGLIVKVQENKELREYVNKIPFTL